MTYTFAGGQRPAAPGDHHILPKPVQSAQGSPAGQSSDRHGFAIAKQEPVAKPWAHFVAGGKR